MAISTHVYKNFCSLREPIFPEFRSPGTKGSPFQISMTELQLHNCLGSEVHIDMVVASINPGDTSRNSQFYTITYLR